MVGGTSKETNWTAAFWDATDKPGTVLYFHGLIYVEVLLQDE
jgi:hypothetical protein